MDFILECETKEEANRVDRNLYVYDGFSETKKAYLFHLRRKAELKA